jgi:hypothetical protein
LNDGKCRSRWSQSGESEGWWGEDPLYYNIDRKQKEKRKIFAFIGEDRDIYKKKVISRY